MVKKKIYLSTLIFLLFFLNTKVKSSNFYYNYDEIIGRLYYLQLQYPEINKGKFKFPDRYHTYGEMVNELHYLNIQYPEITKIYIIGYTQRFNLPILAIRITSFPQIEEQDKPTILFDGIHHASEILGCEMCLYLANKLCQNYYSDSLIKNFVDNLDIWIVPMVNPDGHYITEMGLDSLWRKNLRDNNNNGRIDLDYDGVDLNRNYDFLFEYGGSGEPSNRYYRGPYPFSEPEVCAIRDLALRKKFILNVSFHSDMNPHLGERIYYPWRWGNSFSPDHPHIKAICDSFALNIINDANNGTYLSIYGTAEGGVERNYLYYALGTFAFTCELWRGYYPPEERVDTICEKAFNGVKYLLKRILQSHLAIKVLDFYTNQPLKAEVRVLEAYAPPETILPRYTDPIFGRARRILKPGIYTIEILKEGYYSKRFSIELPSFNIKDTTIYLEKMPGWIKKAEVPSFKRIRSGGALCALEDKIYALIGNNTRDLFCYDINSNSWQKISEVPEGRSKKNVKRGASISTDGRYIYVVKGNNTKEFYRYDPINNCWKEYEINFSKGIRGSSMAFDGDSFIYIICGSNNNEWTRFNRYTEKFETCNPKTLPGEKWKIGSWIVYCESAIYALRVGGKTNEFYKIANGEIIRKEDMPLIGSTGKPKKAKEGSAGAYDYNNKLIYALKGNNTWEFFAYDILNNQWRILEDVGIPYGRPEKKVKGGGALTYSNFAQGLFAFIGNNTNEFWFYLPYSILTFQNLNLTTKKVYKNISSFKEKETKGFDLTGRRVNPSYLKSGIYFFPSKKRVIIKLNN
ncbi:MAG: M14 family zinc carboxypeptidase [candidate division WOR-3 bacterium]|nr:M14 family zinc carboxypeptidase [candidate division WOR-3 bacterium]